MSALSDFSAKVSQNFGLESVDRRIVSLGTLAEVCAYPLVPCSGCFDEDRVGVEPEIMPRVFSWWVLLWFEFIGIGTTHTNIVLTLCF